MDTQLSEAFVVELERRRLHEADRPDLARNVRWIADEDGDGAGYDVLSFHPGGEPRLIEVKTTNGPARTPFFLSRNELAVAVERPEDWRLYRVHLFANAPRVFTLTPPLDGSVRLTTETWARFLLKRVHAQDQRGLFRMARAVFRDHVAAIPNQINDVSVSWRTIRDAPAIARPTATDGAECQ